MAAAAPRRVEIIPWGFYEHKVGSFTFSRFQGSVYLGGGLSYASAGSAVNDEIGWVVTLDAGTWALDLIHAPFTDRAIYTLKLDSTTIGTIDGYGTSSYNVVSTVTGITVSTAGQYTLKSVHASKNASSSGYNFAFQLIVLRRTGA